MQFDPAFITAALQLGIQAYKQAKRLQSEGVEVPGLDEFEQETAEIASLPDLADE